MSRVIVRRYGATALLVVASACLDEPVPDQLGQSSRALTPVTWTDVVGVTASGNDLAKTAPETAWNAGAASVETLAGDGFVEFTTRESTADKMAGLSNGNSTTRVADIDFAIRLSATGLASVWEGGTKRAAMGAYAAGDVFRVQAEDGVVTYYKNGVLKYTSALAPGFPLLVDTALRTPGATIDDVVLEFLDFWTAGVRVAVDGNDITKTAPEDLFNAGAVSIESIPSGDGYVEFRVADATTDKAAGLSNGNANQSRGDIDFALSLTAMGSVQVHEAGTNIGAFGKYVAGDKFQVGVSGVVVTYYRNWVPLYTSLAAPTFPLLLDTSIKTPGAPSLDSRVVAGLPVPACSPLEASLPHTPVDLDAEADVLVLGDPPVVTVYRHAVDGWLFEQDLLKPQDPPQSGWGALVETDGQTIAVGGDYPRSVQLFRHDGAGWEPEELIEPCPGSDLGQLYFDVAGDVLAAVDDTDPSRLRIYRRRPATGRWRPEAILMHPTGKSFRDVALGGDSVFVGIAPTAADPEGAVFVYRYDPSLPDTPVPDPCSSTDPGKWQLMSTIVPTSSEHRFGLNIDAGPSGRRLIIGDSRQTHHDAHIFELVDGAWIQVAELTRTLGDQKTLGEAVNFGGPGGESIVTVGTGRIDSNYAIWVFADLGGEWRLVSYTDYGDVVDVAAADDSVFTINNLDDVVDVQGIDPVCLAE